ncbi:hypothetical protein G7047_11820 [Diaphorobacter sp. HDW4A]|uniref:hypothetical protein n=1 Tax=Diaphorobacter sp. HDW4A TaxID=2714924 RepID=UPI0014084FAD|nr:hypothetical protein [Diaphorobacter sp. HDW4A]QIL80514.1 hypothetical protein G7047_11820 [Diaphorobacter sp. HDW4A]
MSLTVDQNGAVSCTLSSAAGNGKYSGKGGIISQSPFIVSCNYSDFPGYLSLSGSGTPGGTLTGQYLISPTINSQSMQGNFTVSASGSSGGGASNQLSPKAITGLWYDPAYNGTGFNFLMTDANFIATYYGRNSSGGLLWLISTEAPSAPLQTGTEYALTLGATTAGTFSTPAYQMANWGHLNITFTSCTTAKATLNGLDGVQYLNLQRLGNVGGVGTCQ